MKTRPQIKLHNPIVTNPCVSLLQSVFEIHFVSTNKKATNQHPTGCVCYLPKTRIFLPDGSLDLERVETSLRMEDLGKQQAAALSRGTERAPAVTAPWTQHIRTHGPAHAGWLRAALLAQPQPAALWTTASIPPSREKLAWFLNRRQEHLKFSSLITGHNTTEHYFSTNSHRDRLLYSTYAFLPL